MQLRDRDIDRADPSARVAAPVAVAICRSAQDGRAHSAPTTTSASADSMRDSTRRRGTLRTGHHMNNWVSEILSEVRALPASAALENFYVPSSDVGSHFGTTAPERLAHLDQHLRSVAGGELVVVGEAAGWRGARQSGVAFTDAGHVGSPGTREQSARTVRAALEDLGRLDGTLLWNALPLHPRRAGTITTNRTPSRYELGLGQPALSLALSGRAIVCVGAKSAEAVSLLLGIEVLGTESLTAPARAIRVRHPSYGGGPDFRRQLASAITSGALRP
jgi:hypothetical protein